MQCAPKSTVNILAVFCNSFTEYIIFVNLRKKDSFWRFWVGSPFSNQKATADSVYSNYPIFQSVDRNLDVSFRCNF